LKVLFAGPSLSNTPWVTQRFATVRGIECRGPAAQGDIALAVVEGATAIGLVDGCFEDIAAVWHKEILFALSEGVQVFGAASMGALRAAECAAYGMIGIGRVFHRYMCGELTDDAAVAQIHAPAEFGYAPLSEALVNVEATLTRLVETRAISAQEAGNLDKAARSLFFKERTYSRILCKAALGDGSRGNHLRSSIRRLARNVKQEDALALVDRLLGAEARRFQQRSGWKLQPTRPLMITIERAEVTARERRVRGMQLAS
jgi:hypothetical protein